MEKMILGPFTQLLTMEGISDQGPIKDELIYPLHQAGVLVFDGLIVEVGNYHSLVSQKDPRTTVWEAKSDLVVLPGFIDAHTHLCFAGHRAQDFNLRLEGANYQAIAESGGGILRTVRNTRNATKQDLMKGLVSRLDRQISLGVTTCEIKSGYGLSQEAELKMLEAINMVGKPHLPDIVPTCLAAHTLPPEYQHSDKYLQWILEDLLPEVRRRGLSKRVDIFIEDGAFSPQIAGQFLEKAVDQGFELCVHADQFSAGGSVVGVDRGALSVDHLEASGPREIKIIAESATVATVLPGASLGLGMPFAPARKLLDAGACMAIASDWNPGSAPMGNLLIQAALLATYEKLTHAETLAGLTFRAAKSLNLSDRGKLKPGMLADFIAFPTNDYREILYHQGMLRPAHVWKRGSELLVKENSHHA